MLFVHIGWLHIDLPMSRCSTGWPLVGQHRANVRPQVPEPADGSDEVLQNA
jgi:hypothetical protein